MKTLFKLSLVLVLALGFSACKKNQTGGKASVKGVVAHHGKPIADAYVYIKFNATEFPGEDFKMYDTYVKANSTGNYSIPLYKGSYYLYAKGYDLDIPSPFEVKGGTSFSIRNKENLTIDIAVSED
jgi:hypothetical protein